MSASLRFNFDPARTAAVLAAVMLLLVVCHLLALQANFNEDLGIKRALGFEYWQIAIFDLDEEESFGTWFSTMLLLFAAVLFFDRARAARARSDRSHYWWWLLGAGFCLMSVDEVVGLHELINTLFDESVWAILSRAIVLVVGVGFLPFLWRYRWRTALLFVVAGLLFVGGALGVEHYSGEDVNSLGYNMLTGLEEGMEMSGVIVAIYTLLELIAADGTAARG